MDDDDTLQPARETLASWSKSHAARVPRKGRRVPRNIPCPCGSGRKYKHYCGRPHVQEAD